MRRLGVTAALLLALCAMPAASLANGIGDLYVSSGSEVLEMHVVSGRSVASVPLPAPAGALSFTPDGKKLYVGQGDSLATIDIETISLAGSISLPAAAAALAHPAGKTLLAALPGDRVVGRIDFATGRVGATPALPGAVDLLAADRRVDAALAAEAGGRWLAVVAADGTVTELELEGRVVAIDVDAAGIGYAVTSSPNRLLRFELAEPEIDDIALPGVPTALAAGAEGRLVIATGDSLLLVDERNELALARANGAPTSLAASDDGWVIYAAEEDRIEAFAPDGGLLGTIMLSAGQQASALAPIPGPSSVGPRDGGPPGSGPGSSPAPDDDLPNTSTERIADWPAFVVVLLVAIAGAFGLAWLLYRLALRLGWR